MWVASLRQSALLVGRGFSKACPSRKYDRCLGRKEYGWIGGRTGRFGGRLHSRTAFKAFGIHLGASEEARKGGEGEGKTRGDMLGVDTIFSLIPPELVRHALWFYFTFEHFEQIEEWSNTNLYMSANSVSMRCENARDCAGCNERAEPPLRNVAGKPATYLHTRSYSVSTATGQERCINKDTYRVTTPINPDDGTKSS